MDRGEIVGEAHQSAELRSLRIQADKIARDSRYYAEVYYAGETPWFYLRYWFGIPSTVLAAAAGITAFLKFPASDVVSGVVSTIVAVLAATYMALDPMVRAFAFHDSATRFEGLYHDANFFIQIYLSNSKIPISSQRLRLEALHSRLTALKGSKPAVAARAYRRAEKVMKGELFGEVREDPDISTGSA